jgi:hypothetical protein
MAEAVPDRALGVANGPLGADRSEFANVFRKFAGRYGIWRVSSRRGIPTRSLWRRWGRRRINEDRLGLDRVYVQAKRYAKGNTGGRPEIQAFVGSLLIAAKTVARVHFWPFDGWDIPSGCSIIAEVYSKMWNSSFALEGRTADQHDAYSVARWLSRADHDGTLAAFLRPALSPSNRSVAEVEGWILGVAGWASNLGSVRNGEYRLGARAPRTPQPHRGWRVEGRWICAADGRGLGRRSRASIISGRLSP